MMMAASLFAPFVSGALVALLAAALGRGEVAAAHE